MLVLNGYGITTERLEGFEVDGRRERGSIQFESRNRLSHDPVRGSIIREIGVRAVYVVNGHIHAFIIRWVPNENGGRSGSVFEGFQRESDGH